MMRSHNLLSRQFVSLAVLVFGIGFTWSVSVASDEPAVPPPAAEPVIQPFVLLPVRPPFAKGPLREIDKSRKSIVIETKSGLLSFVLTDRTNMFRGPERLTIDRLKLGEIVAVRFTTDANDRRVVSHAKVYPDPTIPAAGTNGTARINSALPPP